MACTAAQPGPNDLIRASFDGVPLLSQPFSAFGAMMATGSYLLLKNGVLATLDFNHGKLMVLTGNTDLTSLDPSNGVTVEFFIGSKVAVETVPMMPLGNDLLIYRRPGT
jgi:hypothetical protein